MVIKRLSGPDELDMIQHITAPNMLDEYARKLKDRSLDVFICIKDDAVVGKVCIDYDTGDLRTIKDDRVFLFDIFVVEHWRNQRIAQELIARTLSELKEEGYIEFSICDNTEGESPASRIRKKFGFTDDWETFYVKSN